MSIMISMTIPGIGRWEGAALNRAGPGPSGYCFAGTGAGGGGARTGRGLTVARLAHLTLSVAQQ
jgi:hypothetical protein